MSMFANLETINFFSELNIIIKIPNQSYPIRGRLVLGTCLLVL